MAHERQGKPTHKNDEKPRFTDFGTKFLVTLFDNLEFDIFNVGGLQCHIIMSVTIAVRI